MNLRVIELSEVPGRVPPPAPKFRRSVNNSERMALVRGILSVTASGKAVAVEVADRDEMQNIRCLALTVAKKIDQPVRTKYLGATLFVAPRGR